MRGREREARGRQHCAIYNGRSGKERESDSCRLIITCRKIVSADVDSANPWTYFVSAHILTHIFLRDSVKSQSIITVSGFFFSSFSFVSGLCFYRVATFQRWEFRHVADLFLIRKILLEFSCDFSLANHKFGIQLVQQFRWTCKYSFGKWLDLPWSRWHR